MKYLDAINYMLSEANRGIENINSSSKDFIEKVVNEIIKAKCSIATAHVFIGFIEEQLLRKEDVKFSETMLHAGIFIGNGMGLDPFKYSDIISKEDLKELELVRNFKA